jgi:glutamine synthetase adenylyltransferase
MAITRNRRVALVLKARRFGAYAPHVLFISQAVKKAKVSGLKQAGQTVKAAAAQFAALTPAQKKPFEVAAKANSAKRAALKKQLDLTSGYSLYLQQVLHKYKSYGAFLKDKKAAWSALPEAKQASYNAAAEKQNGAAEALLTKLRK